MTERRPWTLISSHGAVLIEVARGPGLAVHEIAGRAGLTDRHAYRMLADLCDEGYLVRERAGSRTRYRVDPDRPLRYPALNEHRVADLLDALAVSEEPPGTGG